MSAVTANASTQVGSPVTCYGCRNNVNNDATSRKADQRYGDLHCTTCHQYGHRACAMCGACLVLPNRWGHARQKRWDQFFCSSTCRVKALRERELAQFERAAWEAENPAEAAKQQAEWEERGRELRGLVAIAGGGGPERGDRHPLQETAEHCAHVTWKKVGEEPVVHPATKEPTEFVRDVYEKIPCEVRFGPGHVIYRRYSSFHNQSPVLPYCETHVCPGPNHNRELDDGRYFPYCSCLDDPHARRSWSEAEPCTYCGRLVRTHTAANPSRFVREWQTSAEAQRTQEHLKQLSSKEERQEFMREVSYGKLIRTFCSDRCKRAVFRMEAKAKRLAARGDLDRRCAVCKRSFVPERSDARYCSSACRQRAYRARKGTP